MDSKLKNIFTVCLATCVCLMMGSCIYEHYPVWDDERTPDGMYWNDGPVVMFHISTLSENSQTAASGMVQERIQSLRIIMIHEADGEVHIESNRLIDTKKSLSSLYNYLYQKRTVAGTKRFYLIANEESVPNISLPQGAGGFPAEIGDNPTLTKFLNYYEPDMVTDNFGGYEVVDKSGAADGDGSADGTDGTGGSADGTGGSADGTDSSADGSGGSDDADGSEGEGGSNGGSNGAGYAADFEMKLRSLYFAPKETSYEIGADKSVYLPYSAYYTYTINKDDKFELDYTDKPMYLVPVATKFAFKFINYRTANTAIHYLILDKINRTNYLMANIGSDDEYKYVSGVTKPLYWIDWLKEVAGKTSDWDSNGNLETNSMYGWITTYETPFGDNDGEPYDFVSDGVWNNAILESQQSFTSDAPWVIAGVGSAVDNGNGDGSEPDAGSGEDSGEGSGEGEDSDAETGSGSGSGSDSDDEFRTDTTHKDFYLPEGHNWIVEENDKGELVRVDKYKLRIRMSDAVVDAEGKTSYSDWKTAETEVSYLGALFRNTSVQITITLRAGGVHIYAEPADWDPHWVNGYVQDEDDIK